MTRTTKTTLPLLLALGALVSACVARGDETNDADSASSDVTSAGAFTETTSSALAEQACGPGSNRGCYTNYAVTADLDGDGNLDLVLANGGDHFLPGDAEPQVLFFGDGTGKFADGSRSLVNAAPSIVRQVAVADFDGDGKLDIYFPGGYGAHDDQLFMQVGTREFENQVQRIGGGRSHAGGVHAGDVDNDGDIDLVIADWGAHPNPDESTPASPVTIRILENDGTGNFRPGAVLEASDGSTATDIDLQDVNGDFALDIILTNRNGQSRLYFNDGKGTFTDVTRSKSFPKKQGPFTFNSELCDVDGDGDLDLLFDGGGSFLPSHSTQLLINDGTGVFTDETNRITGEPASDDNQVKCADVDNDGDFDLVVASLTNATEKLLRNDGTGHFKAVGNAFPGLGDPTLAIDLGDFDGDGRVDLFTGQGEVPGAPWLDRIFKNGTTTADRNKPIFRRVEHPKAAPGKPTILRLAISDAHTSETGQHVKNVRLALIAGGVEQNVDASFIGGDVFRAVLPAFATGMTVKIQPHATDRAGNEGAGEAFEIKVAE